MGNIKFVIFPFLLSITNGLFAELEKNWEIVQVGKEAIFFIDRDSYSVENEIATIWQLENFREIKRIPPQSISSQMDYDCKNSKFRIFMEYHHSGVMSKGKFLVANIEGKFEWKPIERKSLASQVFSIVCEKPPQFAEIKKPKNEVSNKEAADKVQLDEKSKDETQ